MVHTENTLLYNSNVRMKPNNQDIKKKAKLELMPLFCDKPHGSLSIFLIHAATNVPKIFDSMCLGLQANTSECNLHGALGQLSLLYLTIYLQSLCKLMSEHRFCTQKFVLR